MSKKSVYKVLGLPNSRAGFLKDFDGNTDALAGLQQAIEQVAETNPEIADLWASAARNSGGDIDQLVQSLADGMYGPGKAEPVGVRGKTDAPPERMESGMPTVESAQEKSTLPEPPAEKAEAPRARVTISPAARQHAASLGVDLSKVTGSGKNGAITKGDIDKVASAGKPEAAPAQAAAPAAKPAMPEDDLSDLPIPGGLNVTQADLDAAAEPMPGTFGLLTRGDVSRYQPHVMHSLGTDLPETAAAPMDMGKLAAASRPPAPAPTATSPMDMQRLGAAKAPQLVPPPVPVDAPARSAMDMQKLSSAAMPQIPPTQVLLPDSYTAPAQPQSGVLAGLTADDMHYGTGKSRPKYDAPPSQATSADTDSGKPSDPRRTMFGGTITPATHPVTSMKDAFFKSMGSPVMQAMGGGFDPVTRPIDFAIRNPLITLGGAGLGGYSMMQGEDNSAPPEVMQQLDANVERARQEFENHLGKTRK